MSLARKIIEDYIANGPGTLRAAIQEDPYTRYALPMIHKAMDHYAPLFKDAFKEDFGAEFIESPVVRSCGGDPVEVAEV